MSVADLKTNLAAHLVRMRGGDEIVVERRITIAKLVPLAAKEDASTDDLALVAEGKARLPTRRLPWWFWKASGPRVATDRARELLGEDRDAC